MLIFHLGGNLKKEDSMEIMKRKKCEFCNTKINEDSKYCPYCKHIVGKGNKTLIDKASSDYKALDQYELKIPFRSKQICTYCGKNVEYGDEYCVYCGSELADHVKEEEKKNRIIQKQIEKNRIRSIKATKKKIPLIWKISIILPVSWLCAVLIQNTNLSKNVLDALCYYFPNQTDMIFKIFYF